MPIRPEVPRQGDPRITERNIENLCRFVNNIEKRVQRLDKSSVTGGSSTTTATAIAISNAEEFALMVGYD